MTKFLNHVDIPITEFVRLIVDNDIYDTKKLKFYDDFGNLFMISQVINYREVTYCIQSIHPAIDTQIVYYY